MTRKQLLALQLSLISIAAAVFIIASAHAGGGSGQDMPVSVGISNQSTVSATNSSAQVVAANANRAYLLIQNAGTTNSAQCKFNSTITGNEGVVLAAGVIYQPTPAPVGSIWCKSASGTTINVLEGVK